MFGVRDTINPGETHLVGFTASTEEFGLKTPANKSIHLSTGKGEIGDDRCV